MPGASPPDELMRACGMLIAGSPEGCSPHALQERFIADLQPFIKLSGGVVLTGQRCRRRGNIEDFIAYGFYAKRVEDLSKEVRPASC